MDFSQLVPSPAGIKVFGSAIVRVEPDTASLTFAVSRLGKHPRDAFREARESSQRVWAFLTQAKLDDVGTSRMTLTETFDYSPRNLLGYTARIAYHLLLRDLDRLEEILVGIVDSGANEITSVEFQSIRLKEFRAEARRRAVQAARDKALLYCEAASVTLGQVLHLEDVNPDTLRGTGSHQLREQQPDDDGETLKAFDPGSIVIGGAVRIIYEIKR